MAVPEGGRLVHYWRDNDAPGFPWHQGADIISAPTLGSPTRWIVNGASLVQNSFGGDLELVAWLHTTSSRVVAPGLGGVPQDYLEHHDFARSTLRWVGAYPITADGQLVQNVSGPN
jgi:hypothetical protein